MGEPKGQGREIMGYLGSLCGSLSLGLDKGFLLYTVFQLSFARQGRNHYTFYLDTPYLPFTHLSTSTSFPVSDDCGGRWALPHLGISLSSSTSSSARWMTHGFTTSKAHNFGGQCQALEFDCLDGPVQTSSVVNFVLAKTLLRIFGVWTVDNINSTPCFTSNLLVHIQTA